MPYLHPPCDRCDVSVLCASPNVGECPSCMPQRRPANDEPALDDASDLPDVVEAVHQ